MRPAISTLILACIAALGAEFAAAQAVSDPKVSETTDQLSESSVSSAAAPREVPKVEAVGDTGGGRANVGPVRWMAPEAIDKRVASAAPGASDGNGETQTRKNDDEGRTDKSQAARARKINGEPCPVAPPGGSDPTSTAAGASSTASPGAAAPGCGSP